MAEERLTVIGDDWDVGERTRARLERLGLADVRPDRRLGRRPQPLLGGVLTGLLAGHREPCLAKDLRDELVLKHPDREPTPQVVRNTLESLVAKGRVNRHKEERSVRYTLTDRGRRATR